MRLFIAVNFCGETKKQILEIQDKLRAQTLQGNFTRPENLHLTLVFIGETPKEKLDCLFRIMEEIQAPPFEISFNCSGCFSNNKKELWWIGTDTKIHPVLENIHRQLLDRLLGAGFQVDTRQFKAHITIGREIKRSRPVVPGFREPSAGAEGSSSTMNSSPPGIKVKVDRISLMKSEHVQGRLTYTEIFGRELSGEMKPLP